MKRNILALSACSILIVIFCEGCSWAQSPSSKARTESLKIEDILKAFKAAGLPIEKEIIYTEENDTNKLLGRPGQYIAKAKWADKRIEQPVSGDLQGGTVEAFESQENLERRKKYIEKLGEASSLFVQYIFAHKNVLLRLEKALTPTQAAEYEKVLKQL
jgi:hypothetical protein